ncbi:MAG: hypothetical protein GQ574_22285 [Crocinitomix sp.]|nr:hypothetical protein [Crocinitomix sp.]
MLKIILINFALFLGTLSYAQEPSFDFQYKFSITGITENGAAKMQIDLIRKLMGVKAVKFDDSLDRFIVFTHLEFDPAELLLKLVANGVAIEGEIVKIDLG